MGSGDGAKYQSRNWLGIQIIFVRIHNTALVPYSLPYFFINTFFCSCSITSSSVLFLVQLIFAGEGKAGIVIFYRGLIFY